MRSLRNQRERVTLWGMHNPVRGLLHGSAAALALAGAIWLAVSADTVPGRMGLVVFGLGLTTLFLTSALYHSVGWSEAAKQRMQRLDHSMIFIAISATFTPFGVLMLHGWVRVTALALVWGLATAGIAAVVKSGGGGRGRRVAAMIGLGWLGGMLAVPVGQQLGFVALVLLASGGTMYSAGGLLFALQWPRLWPRAFSYHEVFHGLVVLAAVLHFSAVYFYLLPLDAA